MNKVKKKYVIVNVILILMGIISALSGILSSNSFFYDLGFAFITGGITALITTIVINEKDDARNLDSWGLVQIYSKRSDMNSDCDVCLNKCIKHLDFIALGLKGFRDAVTDIVIEKINSGVNVRIITVDPNSKFLKQKAKEEGSHPLSLENNINDMISWAKEINSQTRNDAVQVKTYDGLPMFSYQRIDDYVFVGPNLYGLSSQKCISYEYYRGEGMNYFVNHFEKLWNNSNMKSVL